MKAPAAGRRKQQGVLPCFCKMTGIVSFDGELHPLWDFRVCGGTSTTGNPELNHVCRTRSFTKDFDPQSVRLALSVVVLHDLFEAPNRPLST